MVDLRVEADAGGTVTVRVVNYGWGQGWDDQFDPTRHGWRLFLANLKVSLERFGGQPCRQIRLMSFAMAPHAEVWARLVGDGGLGVAADLPDLAIGDRLRAAPPTPSRSRARSTYTGRACSACSWTSRYPACCASPRCRWVR